MISNAAKNSMIKLGIPLKIDYFEKIFNNIMNDVEEAFFPDNLFKAGETLRETDWEMIFLCFFWK